MASRRCALAFLVALSLPSSRATSALQSHDSDALQLTSGNETWLSNVGGVVSLDATHAVACFVLQDDNEAKCFAMERSGTTLSRVAWSMVLIDSVAACGQQADCARVDPHADWTADSDSQVLDGNTWRCAAQPGQTPQPQRRASHSPLPRQSCRLASHRPRRDECYGVLDAHL